MTAPDPSLNSLSLAFAEELYENYLLDPTSVPEDWRRFFDAEARAAGNGSAGGGAFRVGPSFSPPTLFNPAASSAVNGHATANGKGGDWDASVRQDRVDQLIRAYRVRGHMIAQLDPLGLPRPNHPELDPAYYELTDVDLDRKFSARTIAGKPSLSLREILDQLRNTYCRSIGVQFMHIDDLAVKNWLQDRMEGSQNRLKLTREQQLVILERLSAAVIFEEFIQKKYLKVKSFSLEGLESLIPLLAFAIDRAAEHGVDECVLGMAHRGRLNVLANIMGKSPADIFREFEDKDPEKFKGSGDVKYHMGYSSDFTTMSGKHVHLSLCFNPSHLEFVNPVVLGRCRAKQDRAGDRHRETKMPIIIHGDAAFAGEGIVQETLNLSQLDGYWVGGALHVVANNQIGFTTSPSESRSTTYATDVAKMLQIPIFHVNGEDPEAVAQVVLVATDFIRTFRRDVVIDLYGYRRHGHNEGDEPTYTHPLMYKAIAARSSVRDSYQEQLLAMGEVSPQEGDEIAIRTREELELNLSEARNESSLKDQSWLHGYWQGYIGGPDDGEDPKTGVDAEQVTDLLTKLSTVPEGFTAHRNLKRIFQRRQQMVSGERPVDWGTAELLAFASLATEGTRVRLTGQDAERATFSQRHAVLHDSKDGHIHQLLAGLSDDQAPVEIRNSPLSEAGVMAFDYGYSLDWPDALVLWEAQFGDFVNAAQPIIDQFLVSAEDKWKRLSGLVLLLPHGFEGQGPEHSSARLERFLMLCAEDNIQVAQPTTPAQHYHLLRRQVKRKLRKPLCVFTPKSLLRHPLATSELQEFSSGGFQRVIGDHYEGDRPGPIRRVLLCSGRIYFDLVEERNERKRHDVAIIRLEQLYPLPAEHLQTALEGIADETPVVWVQDEPMNMGPWQFMLYRHGTRLLGRYPMTVAARPESASPATGFLSSHKLEQKELLDTAFGDSE